MTENLNSSRNVSYEQFKILIDFMGQHVGLATGNGRSLEARHKSKNLWNDLAKMLNNSRVGTRKTSDGWSKYWSDYKNKLKKKVNLLKRRKRYGASSKNIITPLTRLERKALIILGPHFETKTSKCSSDDKLEAYHENGHIDTQSESSDRCSVETECSINQNSNEEFDDDSKEDIIEPSIQSIYPKWLIEVEKKRAEADLSRSKAEEIRAIISEKNANAAIIQAEALKTLAEAATTQANAFVRIATMLENRVQYQSEDILPI